MGFSVVKCSSASAAEFFKCHRVTHWFKHNLKVSRTDIRLAKEHRYTVANTLPYLLFKIITFGGSLADFFEKLIFIPCLIKHSSWWVLFFKSTISEQLCIKGKRFNTYLLFYRYNANVVFVSFPVDACNSKSIQYDTKSFLQ